MDDRLLLRICLFSSIIGVILLAVLAGRLEADEGVLALSSGSGKANVIGRIESIQARNSSTVLKLKVEETIEVVAFGRVPLAKEGDFVEVRGTYSVEENRRSIIGDDIRLKNG